MNQLEKLPNEILIVITSYLDFKKRDLFKCRLINKEYRSLIDKPLTTWGYPDLDKCSFYRMSLDYHEYIDYMNKQRLEAERNFEMFYKTMLYDGGWI
jgi:hypothetical protein